MVLLHIIQQRKPPAQRAFRGLAGSPLAVTESPPPTSTGASEGLPRKRGRPPKNGVPMTAAERQREKYKRDTEPQVRSLIAQIIKIVKRGMTTPAAAEDDTDQSARTRALDIRKENRVRLNQLQTELFKLGLQDLRNYLRVLKNTPDSRGRLHGERSGEKPVAGDHTELELIIAAQQRKNQPIVTVLTDTTLEDTLDKIAQDVMNQEKTEVQSEGETEVVHGVKCPVCSDMLYNRNDVWEHFNKFYRDGKRQKQHIEALEDIVGMPKLVLDDANQALTDNNHFHYVNDQVKLFRKQQRHEKKKQADEKKRATKVMEQRVIEVATKLRNLEFQRTGKKVEIPVRDVLEMFNPGWRTKINVW